MMKNLMKFIVCLAFIAILALTVSRGLIQNSDKGTEN